MLIEPIVLRDKFGVNPKGILHVGAHLGEEYELYRSALWFCNIIWVEGQKNLADTLKVSLPPGKNSVINAIVWDEDDRELPFNISNNSQSSSLLDFGTHRNIYPDIHVTEITQVKTKRLDSLINPDDIIDLLVLDIQGVELKAIIGLGKHLNRVNYIYSEVNKKEVYKHCSKVSEMDKYLGKYNFKRCATFWVEGAGWGDALYIKSNLVKDYRLNIFLYKFINTKRSIKYFIRYFKKIFIHIKLLRFN